MARQYDPIKARAANLKRIYGITLNQYAELLERQEGGCALCTKRPSEEGQSLAIDHDHSTGEIRGLLCRYCNHRVIGRHRDANLLRRMAEYVENHTGWFVPKKKKRKQRLPRKRKDG